MRLLLWVARTYLMWISKWVEMTLAATPSTDLRALFYFGAKRDGVSRQHHSGNFNIDESVLVEFSNILYTIVEHYVVKI